MWNRLVDLGQAREEILAAWIAKEELRALLALAVPACTSRRQISHRLWAFYQWCAEIELYRLAQTIQAWRVQIEAFALTGAAGEGVNRLIELETRNAFGFRNPSTNAYDHAAQAVRASWRRTLSGPAVRRKPAIGLNTTGRSQRSAAPEAEVGAAKSRALTATVRLQSAL
jgi:hypothetical protein